MRNNDLKAFVEDHQRLFVLTGAGYSTSSGIPDYRDADGSWKRTPPVRFQAFIADDATRRRYWARSMIGWRRFGQAQPNDAHHALARLKASGRSRMLLTQNVDPAAPSGREQGGHRPPRTPRSGTLHGVCGNPRRAKFQDDLTRLNAAWTNLEAVAMPDGELPVLWWHHEA